MARDSSSTDRSPAPSLRDGLAALAATERARRDLPTAEELLALAAGTLPSARREELLDQLADDPELADVYLELQRSADAPRGRNDEASTEANTETSTDPELDAAWRDFEARRRRARWPALAAALLVVATGLALLWRISSTRTDPARTDPDATVIASYHRLDAPADVRRDPRVVVPADAPGIVLAVDRRQLESVGVVAPAGRSIDLDDLEVSLLDAADHALALARPRWSPDDETLLVPVAADALTWGRTVRLVVRSDDGTFEWVLTPTAAP